MLSVICAIVFSATGTYVLLTYNIGICFYGVLIPFLLLLGMYGFFLIIFRNNIAASILSSVVLLLVYFVDAFVYQSRYFHIRYSDISVINDAIRVAGNYRFSIIPDHVRIIVIVTATCIAICALTKILKPQKRQETVLVGIICCCVSFLFFLTDYYFVFVPIVDEGINSSEYVPNYGLAYSWYNQYRNSRFRFPGDYSIELAESILDNTKIPEKEISKIDEDILPNIIVIMNESFSDFGLCGEIEYSDPLLYIHGSRNKLIENKMLVSIYGGYTANTEYEFLTGNSLLFMPNGVIPYMNYMNHDLPSFARDLKSLGYSTTAIHPYYSAEWNRVNAYRCMGFDKFVSGDSLINRDHNSADSGLTNLFAFGDDVEYIRGFISDRQCYDYILSAIDETVDKGPFFVFAVTIQNHGGYLYQGDDFASFEYTGIKDVDQYLTLSSESDKAFYQLLEQLKQSERRTIVLMFGDHQPAINIDNAIIWNTSIEAVNKYMVPYILWSNYDTDYITPEVVSPNYLSAVFKVYAELPLTSWDAFRLDVMKEYVVLSTNVIQKNGKWMDPKDVSDDQWLHDYEIVQDYMLFDSVVK